MNQQHAYTFVQFSDIAKNWHFCTLIIVNISDAPLRDLKTFDKRRFICSNNNWFGCLGVLEILENSMLIFVISNKSRISVIMTLFMTSQCKNRLGNDVITPNINSAGIHLLYYQSFRPIQSFSFLDKSTRTILPFVAKAPYTLYNFGINVISKIVNNMWENIQMQQFRHAIRRRGLI